MTHCHSGVEKGRKKGGNPIEVMGLILGRPDPLTPHTLVVTDVFPLPIEGFETRVVADDQDVTKYMIELVESLEKTRKEKIMGWYHSHPFDLGENSHCFLSQTDITTQLSWQNAEDPFGNPFLAMVVDPLRSLAKHTPNVKAFRAYPANYKKTVANQCPDGSIITEEKLRLEKWGSCWDSYYELDIEYFMSNSARSVMDILTKVSTLLVCDSISIFWCTVLFICIFHGPFPFYSNSHTFLNLEIFPEPLDEKSWQHGKLGNRESQQIPRTHCSRC